MLLNIVVYALMNRWDPKDIVSRIPLVPLCKK